MTDVNTKYRIIYDLIDEMVFILNSQFKIINYNSAAGKILALTPNGLLENSISKLVDKKSWLPLYKILNSEKIFDTQIVKFINQDGSSFYSALKIHQVKFRDEKIIIIIAKNLI